jgi:hypothetical protein
MANGIRKASKGSPGIRLIGVVDMPVIPRSVDLRSCTYLYITTHESAAAEVASLCQVKSLL